MDRRAFIKRAGAGAAGVVLLGGAGAIRARREDPPDQLLHGVLVPIDGWRGAGDTVESFQNRSSSTIECIRDFPAGEVLSVEAIDKHIANWPNTASVWSTFMAGKNFTNAQVADFAALIRSRADNSALPRLYVTADAEFDRSIRPYNRQQFIDGFIRLRNAVGNHPKIVWYLNPTGYDFANRFGTADGDAPDRPYDTLLPHYDVLGVDPYSRGSGPAVVDGHLPDLQAAKKYADSHGKRLALPEWGIDKAGEPAVQRDNMNLFFAAFRRILPLEFLCYFQTDNTNARWDTRIEAQSVFDTYGFGMNQLKNAQAAA